jgi:hypothetical protein
MGSFIDSFENKVLDHILINTALNQPTNIYVALSTADPLDTGAGIAEPSGNNYGRAQCNTWDTAASRATANTAQINFAQASGSWGTITHWALYDAITGGALIAHGQFTVSKLISAGHTPFIKAGELDVSFNTGGISTYLANKVLDHVFKNTALTQYTNLYVGVSTGNPGDTGTLTTEPSGNAYARLQVNDWDAAASGASQNTAAITFVEATGSWGTIAYAFIVDSDVEGSGNVLIYGALGASQAIGAGDVLEFAAGAYDITLD